MPYFFSLEIPNYIPNFQNTPLTVMLYMRKNVKRDRVDHKSESYAKFPQKPWVLINNISVEAIIS